MPAAPRDLDLAACCCDDLVMLDHGGDRWIRRLRPTRPVEPDPPSPSAPPERGGRPRVVCFPHAGGAASFYFPLAAALRPDVEVLAVQYPGRQDRLAEEPVHDLHLLADRAAVALRPWCTGPVSLLGHSMGALLAYEVALRLERDGTRLRALFASGRRAPSIHRRETVHLRDDAALLDELRHLAGTADHLLDNPELVRLFLPALRADYQAVETYVPRPGAVLACPVTVLVGDRDRSVSVADARAWQHHTSGGMDLRVYGGGHFFLAGHVAEIAALVRDRTAAPAR